MNYKPIILASVLILFFILESFFPFFKNRQLKKHFIHSIKNILLGLFNSLVTFLIFTKLLAFLFEYMKKNSTGLINTFEIPYYIKFIIGFLILDLWMYSWHLINHNSRILWKFHRMHHTDLYMDGSSAIRFHTIEIILSVILKLPVIIITGLSPEILIYHEIALNISTVFHHSNLYLPPKIDKIIRTIIISPNMHRVHHSKIIKETNSNYSSLFSFWDRLFRTYKMTNQPDRIDLGLYEFSDSKWQNIWGMIKTPFVKIK